MKNCPKCGAPLADDAAFCGNCGANLGEVPQNNAGGPEETVPHYEDNNGAGTQNEGGNPTPPPYGNPYYGPQGDGNPPPPPPYGNGGPYYGPQGDGANQPPYGNPYYGPGYGYQPPQPPPWDHTGEFDPQDVSGNKVLAMVPYLMGAVGLIIALLAMHDSKYVGFHVRQAMKLTVVDVLLGVIMALLCWTIIVPVAGVVCMIIVFVLRIIAFFQVCGGKAKEPAIIRSLGFLK